MAYERVNWENLPSTNTPLNATNLNKMDKGIKELDDNALVFRGNIPSTNLNEIQTTGIYYISNESLTNAPSGCDYSFLIVIGAALVHQYIIKPVINAIYIREYSGSPAQWYNWQTK